MDLKDKIKLKLAEVKKVIFEDETPLEDFVDAKTATGDILKITPAVEVGATVEVITEDGEVAPAPDGGYELEDGSVITVDGGIVSNVESLEAPAEAPAEEEMAAEVDPLAEPTAEPQPFDVDALHKQIIDKLNSSIIERIDKLRFAKEESITELKEENGKLKEAFKGALELIEELANAEAVAPAAPFKPNAFKKKGGRLTIQELRKLTN